MSYTELSAWNFHSFSVPEHLRSSLSLDNSKPPFLSLEISFYKYCKHFVGGGITLKAHFDPALTILKFKTDDSISHFYCMVTFGSDIVKLHLTK